MAAISEVIEFQGRIDDLLWKSPIENFNTTSVLIVDETHQALVTVNGVQYGLYGPGRHILETPNLPGAGRLVNIPTGQKTSFPCKVFYVNMVHQMAMEWGIPGNIKLEDKVYNIFMEIGAHGSLNFVVTDCIKFIEKLVGFREQFSPEQLTNLDNGLFRGIINKWVTSDISKIMISGGVSYFTISENLFEISEVVKEQLSGVFAEYGIGVQEFVIEGVVTDKENTEELAAAKRKHAARKVQGYTWREEREMAIMETAAGNTGTMGGMQGAIAGVMMGGAVGGSLSDMLRGVLNLNNSGDAPTAQGGQTAAGGNTYGGHIDPISFLKTGQGKPGQLGTPQPEPQQATGVPFSAPQSGSQQAAGVPFSAPQTGSQQAAGVPFSAPQSGSQQAAGVPFSAPQPEPQLSFGTPFPAQQEPEPKTQTDMKQCAECKKMIPSNFKFCPYCGTKAQEVCKHCGNPVQSNFAFCPICGNPLK